MHLVAQGDTYASLSKKYYQTEAFAEALKAWNASHELREASRGDLLVPGEKAFIPSIDSLRQTFARLIPEQGPLPNSPSPAPAPTPPTPVTLTPATPATPFSVSPPAAPAPKVTRYKVKAANETLFEIARRSLGNGSRWGEIAALNPDVNPERPVSPEVVLILPMGAQVPAENQP